ncbi:MAG: superoxide dismutase [Ni] [Planctomycetota bacterium]
MKTFHVRAAALLLTGLAVAAGVVHAHCEIPCGIYGDMTRIILLKEDITTIEKSMNQIQELSAKSDALSLNQAVRWIDNKDEHSGKIQETVTQYFLTQRVKAVPEKAAAYGKYLTQVTTLHQMLVEAMKCKQTLDLDHVKQLRALVD